MDKVQEERNKTTRDKTKEKKMLKYAENAGLIPPGGSVPVLLAQNSQAVLPVIVYDTSDVKDVVTIEEAVI